MAKTVSWSVCLALLAFVPGAAGAQASDVPLSPKEQKQLEELDAVMAQPSLVAHHSDLYFRGLGAEAYQAGSKRRALSMFIAASRYADKPSQAMVAAMYWNGEGTAVDRPRAYAWMDLAADRGYRDLVIQRELYWSRLTPAERDAALAVGKEIFDEYGDERGRRRLRAEFHHELMRGTGSHTGAVGNGTTTTSLGLLGAGHAGAQGYLLDGNATPLSSYYSSAVWSADEYLRLKDLQWELQGHVKVGDPEPVSESPDTQPPH
ncbi:sel1 repeat family protein [Dyella telluris]|uniref:Sel1 repeat family protein n=1 Tax=Dyella telluris TaxID=2763498 RepID=A0A7G8PYV7_9GAMM|nr:sel1 repeat family protein [Dyella telluris]QNJ99714.1 sel1 repeat family protein [Dyella telluris]